MRDVNFGYWVERSLANMGVGPLDGPVIFGSAVMKLHGLKDEIGDVDLFVTPSAYHRLRGQGWEELRPVPEDPPFLEAQSIIERTLSAAKVMDFHAFHAWTSRDAWLDLPEAVATAERVCGLMCVRLELVAKWKQEALTWCVKHGVEIPGSPWEKHIADLNTLVGAGVTPA
jgi:hypothetical protein